MMSVSMETFLRNLSKIIICFKIAMTEKVSVFSHESLTGLDVMTFKSVERP